MADNSDMLAIMAAMYNMMHKDEEKSLIKEIDENEDIPPMPDKWPWDYPRWKDYCKRNNITNKDAVEIQDTGYVIKDGFDREIKRIPPTDPKVETGYITRDEENGKVYLHYPDGRVLPFNIRNSTGSKNTTEESPLSAAILKKEQEAAIDKLKYLANEYGKEDPRIKKEKEEKAATPQIDVDKMIDALKKIEQRLMDNELFDASCIGHLVTLIQLDFKKYKFKHNERKEEAFILDSVNKFLNDYEDYLSVEELMIVYYGMYLVRVKFKTARDAGIPGFFRRLMTESYEM